MHRLYEKGPIVMKKQCRNSLHKIETLLLSGGFLFLLFYCTNLESVLVRFTLPRFVLANQGKEESVLCQEMMEFLLPLFFYETDQGKITYLLQDEQTAQLISKEERTYREDGIVETMEYENGTTNEGESAKDVKQPNAGRDEMDLNETNMKGADSTYTDQGKIDPGNIGNGETDSHESDSHESDSKEASPHEESGKREEISREESVFHETPQTELSLTPYESYEKLVSDFYVIDKSTQIGEDALCLEKLVDQSMSLEKREDNQPQILIYHTHAHEEYITEDGKPYTVVDAGNELALLLQERFGYQVLHDTGVYDEVRDYAYAKAAPALRDLLQKHPTIEVIIDLHRDGVENDTHLTTQIDGITMAQIMLFNGLSYTKTIGEIEYLKNENREGNLAFSFQLKEKMMEYYPGLSRKIYLKGYRYNMQYRKRSLLIELGAQNNTKEEVKAALLPLAHSLHLVLS